jgi:hypothetical protein
MCLNTLVFIDSIVSGKKGDQDYEPEVYSFY